MKSLELAVPPPIIMLVTALIMWLLSYFVPTFTLASLYRPMAAVFIGVLGIAFSLGGLIAFKKAQTTPDPRKPSAASKLVTSGVYRVSRNPMYLGIQLMLIAWGFFLGNALSLLFSFAFAAYIQRFQIRPEERYLLDKFGTEFVVYRARVRPWL